MEINREQVLSALEKALSLDIRRVVVGTRTPVPAARKHDVIAYGIPRIVMPLEDSKEITYATSHGEETRVFMPGEVLACAADAWCKELWKRPHRMFSLVLKDGIMRLLTINYRQLDLLPSDNREYYFYHTASMPPAALSQTLSALTSDTTDSAAAPYNVRALLLHAKAFMESDGRISAYANYSWEAIRNYLETHFTQQLTREEIASALKLHPATLSRIVLHHTGRGVIEYITALRMNYATELLTNPLLSIKQVAARCGYSQENYFIRVFRKMFAVAPGAYRNM